MTKTRRVWGMSLCWCCVALLCAPAPGLADDETAWKALTVWQDLLPLYAKAPFPAAVRGKNVALVWNGKHNGDRLLRRFADCLRRAVPEARFVPVGSSVFFSPVSQDMPDAENAVRAISAFRPDLVIFATGDCRVCAAWMAVEAVLLEKAGIPTVGLVTRPFYKTYQNVCRNMRMELLTCLAVPHPVAVIDGEKVDAKAELFFEDFQRLFHQQPCFQPHATPCAATGEDSP